MSSINRISTGLFNLAIVLLLVLVFINLYSFYKSIDQTDSNDLRFYLQGSRQLIEGKDPNFFISPEFEDIEFTDHFTVHGLINRLIKDGILIPHASTELQSINILLNDKYLLEKLPKNPTLASFQSFRGTYSYHNSDIQNRNRLILEMIYPLESPPLQRKNDPSINKRPTLVDDWVQAWPPSLFPLAYPICKYPFEICKRIWVILTYVLFFLSTCLLATCSRWKVGSKLVWITTLFFMATSYSFHLHLIRGQKYIIYLFLLSLAFYLLDKKKMEALSGFFLGFLIAVRPNAVLMAIPFLAFKRWMILIGMLAGLSFGLVLPTISAGPVVWESYFVDMTNMYHSVIDPNLNVLKHGNSFFGAAQEDMQRSFYIPLVNPATGCVTLQSTLPKYIKLSLSDFMKWMPVLGLFMVPLIILLKTKISFFADFNINKISDRIIFLIGSWLFLFSNYFLSYCFLYTDVLWIFPLALIIIYSGSLLDFFRRSFLPILIFLFFSGFAYNWFLFAGIKQGVFVAESVMLVFVPFIILISLRALKRA